MNKNRLYQTKPDHIVDWTIFISMETYLTILDYNRLYQTIPQSNEVYRILLDTTPQNGQLSTIPEHTRLLDYTKL